jgi:hypothetical protein
MWPSSRPPTTLYQPIRDPEQQNDGSSKPPTGSLYPTAPIPRHFLLGGDNQIKQEQLLGGDNKINQTLLMGGNKAIADHLLLNPRQSDAADDPKDENDLNDDDTDFEHLDYLEPGDDVALTSGRRPIRRMPRIKIKTALIASTLLVLLICLITVIFARGGKEHPLGPGDYRK